MTLHLVCPVDEMSAGDARKLDVAPPVAIFRTEEGFFATDDICSHAMASLSEGFVEDETVECPVHMARFCLRTGKVLSPPATKPVAVYPVTVVDGQVFVDLNR